MSDEETKRSKGQDIRLAAMLGAAGAVSAVAVIPYLLELLAHLSLIHI